MHKEQLSENDCKSAGIEAEFRVGERCYEIIVISAPGFSDEDSHVTIDMVADDAISLFDLLQRFFKSLLGFSESGQN